MLNISVDTLNRIKRDFPTGCRVELISMNDPYNTCVLPGCKGTVRHVDDIGTIFVAWDCGSSLGIVYGEDYCKVVEK